MIRNLLMLLGGFVGTIIAGYSLYVATDVNSQLDGYYGVWKNVPLPDPAERRLLRVRDIEITLSNHGPSTAQSLDVHYRVIATRESERCVLVRGNKRIAALSAGESEPFLVSPYDWVKAENTPGLDQSWELLQYCAVRAGVLPGEYFVTFGNDVFYQAMLAYAETRRNREFKMRIPKLVETRAFDPVAVCEQHWAETRQCKESRAAVGHAP